MHGQWILNNDSTKLTTRCSAHHSLEQSTVCYSSSHCTVTQFLNSMNHVYLFFILSNLFFNYFFVRFLPIFFFKLTYKIFPGTRIKVFHRPIPSLYLSFRYQSNASHRHHPNLHYQSFLKQEKDYLGNTVSTTTYHQFYHAHNKLSVQSRNQQYIIEQFCLIIQCAQI